MWKVGKAGLAQPRTVPRQIVWVWWIKAPLTAEEIGDWTSSSLNKQKHISIFYLLSLSTCQDMTSLNNFRCQKNQLLMSCIWITWNSSHFSTLDPWQSILRRTRGTHQQCALGILAPSSEYLLPTRPTESWTPNDTKIFTTGGHEISHQPQNNLCTDSLKEIYGTSTKLPYICIVSSPLKWVT